LLHLGEKAVSNEKRARKMLIKLTTGKIARGGFRVVVVERWSLFKGGR